MQIRCQFSYFIIGEGTLPIQCAEVLLHRGRKISGWAKERQTSQIEPTADFTALLSQQLLDYLFSIITDLDYHEGQCIHRILDVRVERAPDATAMVYEEDQVT